jgi:hypothetical protein
MKNIFLLTCALTFLSFNALAADDDGIGITYDLGVSSGKDTADNTYTEANVGLNLQKSFVAWRNSIFGRFVTGQENIYGLDSSIRGILEDQTGETFGYHLFAGPGYRFVTKGENLPFAEAGLVLRLGGVSIGGGAKMFLNELVDKNTKNETQYMIILGGGGRI